MIARRALALVALLGLAVAGPARAQTTIATPAGGMPIQLEALGGGDPFAAPSPFATADATDSSSVVALNFGFSYLRPFWSTAGLDLQAMAAGNPALILLNPFGDLLSNFGFVPRVELQYDASALGFGMAASAQFINLAGSLQRTATVNGVTADLLATNDLTFVIVNIAEATRSFRGSELPPALTCRFGLERNTYTLAVGTRFTSVTQTWSAKLTDATGPIATSDASGTFSGLGLTGAISVDRPVRGPWGIYWSARTSLLVGPNNRKSMVNGTNAGVPFANTLIENKTMLIPTVEFESGLRYLAPLKRTAMADPAQSMFSVRVGFVGHYWGGLGMLPATPTQMQFVDRPLFLAGFSLLAGVEF